MVGHRFILKQAEKGFTIIELLIVIVVIGILANLVFSNIAGVDDRALIARAQAEFQTMHKAIEVYRIYNDSYPSDVNRDIPPGIEPYLSTNDGQHWPDAPWEGSVYDYDAYISGGEPTYQISIRFCEIGAPETCNFPGLDWAEGFDINSSVYYCISGNCKAHPGEPADHPGYCMNCDENQALSQSFKQSFALLSGQY